MKRRDCAGDQCCATNEPSADAVPIMPHGICDGGGGCRGVGDGKGCMHPPTGERAAAPAAGDAGFPPHRCRALPCVPVSSWQLFKHAEARKGMTGALRRPG
jgi:hypothetical protein